jgi:glycosyltransferase involved in cell wall biosynthesis
MGNRVTILARYSRMGASSRLRAMQYLPALAAAGLDVEVTSFFGDAYLEALYSGKGRSKADLARYFLDRLKQCRAARATDVIWLEKEAFPWLPWAIERHILPANVPIVSDYDDAVFHNYDLHPNPIVRAALGRKIDKVMARSALVTAGNDYLAERARAAGARHVEVVPTVVDVDAYQPAGTPEPGRPLRIGWMGTPNTWAQYGAPMTDTFEQLAGQTGAVFRLVGARLSGQSGETFEFIPWSEATEIASIQGMDIGIMPLADSPWERGKCGYKLIQYMACGLPVVASPVGVNPQIVEHGVNGFLARTEADWNNALRTLLNDAKLRHRMGRAGRQKVVSTYSIQAQGPRVAELLATLAAGGKHR